MSVVNLALMCSPTREWPVLTVSSITTVNSVPLGSSSTRCVGAAAARGRRVRRRREGAGAHPNRYRQYETSHAPRPRSAVLPTFGAVTVLRLLRGAHERFGSSARTSSPPARASCKSCAAEAAGGLKFNELGHLRRRRSTGERAIRATSHFDLRRRRCRTPGPTA